MSAQRSQACERCWRRKQKCSRDTPTCVQCHQASTTCVPRGFGPALDTGEWIASKTGIEAMKVRIRNMRALLEQGHQQESPLSARTSFQETMLQEEDPILQRTVQSESSPTNTLASQSNSVHETMQDDVAYLSLAAMAERTDSHLLATEGLSFLTMLYAAVGIGGSDPTLPVCPNEALSGSLAELRLHHGRTPDIELDSTEMRKSFKRYVELIGHTFPYMTGSELFDRYDHAIAVSNSHDTQALAEHLVIAYLGMATGLLLGPHFLYKEMMATDLALKAVRLLPKVLDHAKTLSAIRCLTALTVYSLYTTLGGSTWHLLGLTMTRCISAGMHTSRSSDRVSQDGTQRDNNRLLWALYIIDTYVSSSLDRPFCLDDRDIMISAPASPSLASDDASQEDVIFPYLIQHSQIIRSIRNSVDSNDDILSHSINIKHWKGTFPLHAKLPIRRMTSMCSYAYAELLKHDAFLLDPSSTIVLKEATLEFTSYFANLEEQLDDQGGAATSFDVVHVFTIGVILGMRTPRTASPPDPMIQLRVQNLLTVLSTRYSVARKYRDIISDIFTRMVIPDTRDYSDLHALINASELAIPRQLLALLFGTTRHTRLI